MEANTILDPFVCISCKALMTVKRLSSIVTVTVTVSPVARNLLLTAAAVLIYKPPLSSLTVAVLLQFTTSFKAMKVFRAFYGFVQSIDNAQRNLRIPTS